MKVLFYLPAVTDRHFEAVVLPLIRVMAGQAEVHVAGPPQWEMAGLSERQLMLCADLPPLQWHIFDGEDHPSLRTAPSNPQELIDYVAANIAPDFTLCRSADVATPMRFPGVTRFMMEPIFPPFAPKAGTVGPLFLDGPGIYDNGFVPELAPAEALRLDTLFAPRWAAKQALLAKQAGSRDAALVRAGLPADKRIIVLPLNVESPTNFFVRQHHAVPSNNAWVEQIAAQLDEDCVLALTRHPLNIKATAYDQIGEPIEPLIESLGGKAVLVSDAGALGNSSASIIAHCDGVIISDSKVFSLAAFFGKPIHRISHFQSAPWLCAYQDLGVFQSDILAGTARAPDRRGARHWFGFHYLNNLFDAHDPALTAEEIVARMARPIVPELWQAGIDRLAH